MIKFIHITDLVSALAIMRTGTFHPVRTTGSDAGLNGLAIGRVGWRDQHFQGTGTCLFLEWSGLCETGHPRNPRPDVLYDQMPYRVFVPIGTTQDLRLTGFYAAPTTWDQHEFNIPWHCLGRARRARARRGALVKLCAEIDGILEEQPHISVAAQRS